MPTKIHKNSFQGGMDKDTDPAQVENFKFLDGFNVSLSQDGKEKKISSFLGTTALQTLAGTVTDRSLVYIMGMYEAKAKIGSTVSNQVDTNVAVVFLYDNNASSNEFQIFVIPEAGGAAYKTYKEDATFVGDDFYVDCVIHKEGGTSYAYFTDGEKAPKKLPLDILTGGKGSTATPYLREEILMIRHGFDGQITDVAVTEDAGGDLLCGTYQFAVRLFNSTLNRYSKWSLMTQPVVVRMPFTKTTASYGGVGYVSSSEIGFNLTTITNYTTNLLYDYFQIAVVENINGGSDDQLTVKLLQPEPYAGTTEAYVYDTNKPAKELVGIDELTVDDAAIKNLKSLAIKNNRLLGLNVNYHNLEYDRNDPIVGSTTTPISITSTLNGGSADAFNGTGATSYRDPDLASKYVGHFRDELYRYAVVYEDEFGNYSKPKVLDFSGVGLNESSSIDWKFPPKKSGKYGSLLDAGGDIQPLGLGIKNLQNHPTWAVAAHIVRVPRKKKIQFQTPLIPSILVQPAKAVGGYPAQKLSTTGKTYDVLNVEATNPDGSFAPKNFFHVLPKSLIRFGDFYGSTVGGEAGGGTSGTVYASAFSEVTSEDFYEGNDNTFSLRIVPTSWTTSTAYSVGDEIDNGGALYTCVVAHTSGTFLTDIATGKWAASSVAAYIYDNKTQDSETFKFTSSSTVSYTVKVFAGSSDRVILAGDSVSLTVQRRAIGSPDWETPATIDIYSYASDTLALDHGTYDYKINVEYGEEIT